MVDKKTVWFGSDESGLYEVDISKPEKPSLIKHHTYKKEEPNSFASSSVSCIEQVGKNIVIGTNGDGVFIHAKEKTFARFSNTEGLPSNNIISNHFTSSNTTITNQLNFTTAIVGGRTSLTYAENTDIDTGTEDVATLNHSTYDAGFFDYVLKKGTNMRAGTIMAVHDGTNIELTDISTADLGNTERVQFSASLDATNLILQAIVPSDNWSVRAYVRGI